MIWYINWKIIDLDFTHVTVLTNSWLGYDVWINELIYSNLALNEEVSLFVYHSISENYESLFWFIDKSEKKIFTELIKISWIGWKVAMQILSLWTDRLSIAIKNEDNKTIESVKWVWKKMAEKIIIELKDKEFLNDIKISNPNKKQSISPDLHSSIKSTLTNMWYNPRDIDNILSELPDDLTETKDIIPFVIKNLS